MESSLSQDGEVEHRENFESSDLFSLVEGLSKELRDIQSLIEESALEEQRRLELTWRLTGLRDAALLIFNNLRRIRVFPGLTRFVVLEGFVPSSRLDSFRDHVGQYLVFAEPVRKGAANEPYVPTLIVNPKIISLFENVTLAQGLPRYNELDPTPIIAFVFPLFFGLMFADVGRGIVLVVVGLTLLFISGGKYKNWGEVLSIFGVSSLLTGVIIGRVFEFEFPTPFENIIPIHNILASGLTPESVILLLGISMIIGTFHLGTGYAIAVINQIWSRNLREALLGHLPTLILYSSAIPLALAFIGSGFQFGDVFVSGSSTPLFRELLGWQIPVFVTARISFPIFAASFLTLILGRPIIYLLQNYGRRKFIESLGEGLLEGFLRPIEFLANTISYVRLGILLIIHILVGSFVSSLLGLGVLGIPLVILANAGLMAIEGLLVYIQDLRLHLYEWFSKFYFGLGIPFSPLVSEGATCQIKWV